MNSASQCAARLTRLPLMLAALAMVFAAWMPDAASRACLAQTPPPAQAGIAAQEEPSIPDLLRDAKGHGPELPVTSGQLRRILADLHKAHKKDAEVARVLASLRLTDRLTGPTLEQIQSTLKPGEKTRTALELLSDQSAFLAPPAAELPNNPQPDIATQQALIDRAVEFVTVRLKDLPDYMATRTTLNFNDEPPVVRDSPSTIPPRRALHLAGEYAQGITYRNGHEVLNDLRVSTKDMRRTDQPKSDPQQLVTTGDFGGILGLVLSDTVKGAIAWSHWERTASGLAAVFDYRIPASASHYGIEFCCVSKELPRTVKFPDGMANSYSGKPGYHGSLSIDPATGAILRMTLESELRPSDPITGSSLWVQYGPVDIGGTSYLCPVRSGAITFNHRIGLASGETVEQINDTTFSDYHRFRATVTILDSPPQ